MIPIMQKLLHDPENGVKGDCLRACICSLLEISDNDVPNFVEDKNYPELLYEFLKSKCYEIINDDEPPKNVEFYMVWGISPRGVMHSVIHSRGKLVHDPNPEGGDVQPKHYVWLEPIK